MQADPILEWQTLTAHYRELSDDELRELAAEFNDLTETAQQVLRTEMRSRGLGDPAAPPPASEMQQSPSIPRKNFDLLAGLMADSYAVPSDPSQQNPEDDQEDNSRVDYTWKTVLCDCDTNQQAQELSATLVQAGIESWVQPAREFGRSYARILVAADQLDQARVIAARPIPPEIVEESQAEVPEFVPPSCPKCRASDPVLEAVDPANSWKCEQCGGRWTESAPAAAELPPKAG